MTERFAIDAEAAETHSFRLVSNFMHRGLPCHLLFLS